MKAARFLIHQRSQSSLVRRPSCFVMLFRADSAALRTALARSFVSLSTSFGLGEGPWGLGGAFPPWVGRPVPGRGAGPNGGAEGDHLVWVEPAVRFLVKDLLDALDHRRHPCRPADQDNLMNVAGA